MPLPNTPLVFLDTIDILKKNRLSKGAWAMDARGYTVDPLEPQAVAYDLVGALRRAIYEMFPAQWETVHDGYLKDALEFLASQNKGLRALVDDHTLESLVIAAEKWNDNPRRRKHDLIDALIMGGGTFPREH